METWRLLLTVSDGRQVYYGSIGKIELFNSAQREWFDTVILDYSITTQLGIIGTAAGLRSMGLSDLVRVIAYQWENHKDAFAPGTLLMGGAAADHTARTKEHA